MTFLMQPKKLSVFLCHAPEDKPKVRELHKLLRLEDTWIEPWLSEEKILPGQDWRAEITEALRNADVIIICLSAISVAKEGFVQAEIKRALDISEQKPERTIFIIPLLFDDCNIPNSLQKYQYHWASDSLADTHPKLLLSLKARAGKLGINTLPGQAQATRLEDGENLNLYLFNKIVVEEVPYTFYVGKYPVTNAQYERFLISADFSRSESIWTGFPKFNEDCIQVDWWGTEGWDWVQGKLKTSGPNPVYWNDGNFGIAKPDNPVVGITWYEANAYCKWLMRHWNNSDSLECRANPDLNPKQIRLPLELEWSAAAGGENNEARYPWDKDGMVTKSDKEVARRANVNGNIGHTLPVNTYLRSGSPYRVMDMGGNVWEWQANFYDKQHKGLALRGGSWKYYQYGARVSSRYTYLPDDQLDDVGFRVVITV